MGNVYDKISMLKTYGTNYVQQWFQFSNIHIYQI